MPPVFYFFPIKLHSVMKDEHFSIIFKINVLVKEQNVKVSYLFSVRVEWLTKRDAVKD